MQCLPAVGVVNCGTYRTGRRAGLVSEWAGPSDRYADKCVLDFLLAGGRECDDPPDCRFTMSDPNNLLNPEVCSSTDSS